MKRANKILPLVLAVLLAATVYGLIRTRGAASSIPAYGSGMATAPGQPLVDQSPLLTAQSLAQMPTTAEELPFAQGALQLGDQEMDLAFASALLDATGHPPVLSAEAKQIQARLQTAEDDLAAEQARVAQITAADAKASGAQKDALDNQLQLAKARLELAQDQVDDAKEDLLRAGGDPQGRIQAMVDAHDAASQSSDATKVNVVASIEPRGLVQRFQQWWTLHQKQLRLWRAKQDALTYTAQFAAQHESLDAPTGAPKAPDGQSPRPAAPPAAATGAARPAAGSATGPSAAQSAVVLAATKRRAAVSKTMSSLDKRVSNEQQLAATYGQWIGVVAAEQRVHVNRALRGVLIILVITLLGFLVDGLMNHLVGKMSMGRRQVATLRSTTRVALQIIAVLLVLLVVFGSPTQLGTVLGLAGAGLTIALQDFIIAFLGWFVLMGKSGLRLGDWVEINGVTGEVVDLSVFHTVLLETGNWADAGLPTGRRVTFTNSFAVQGHYFNFSTSGQWMWDELKIVLPGGQNPYPVVDAIQKKVTEATAEVVQQAEQEWRGAAKSADMHSLSAAPAISVKPVVGGTEISVRYVTSARQHSELRAKLNQAAVDLLGQGHVTESDAGSPKPALTPN